jgi:antitoxin component of MazEF toxin-antitoxin module
MIQMQKVIKVGNSLAVTMDKHFIQETGIRAGQDLAVVYKSDRGIMSVSKTKTGVSQGELVAEEKQAYMAGKITPELKEWTDKFLVDNQEAMKKLADL